jgi:chromosome segregation ATPase
MATDLPSHKDFSITAYCKVVAARKRASKKNNELIKDIEETFLYGDLESDDTLFKLEVAQDLMHQYIDAKNAKMAELEEENAWLLTGIKNSQTQEYKKISKELSRYRVFVEWNKNTIDKLKCEIIDLKGKLDNHELDKHILEEEIMNLNNKLTAKENTIQQLTQKILDLEDNLKSAALDIETLELEDGLLDRENKVLKEKLTAKEHEYNEMVRKLRELYVGKNDLI